MIIIVIIIMKGVKKGYMKYNLSPHKHMLVTQQKVQY